LFLSFLIDPLSSVWSGPSLRIFGDVFIIAIVLYVLINKKYKSYTIWSTVLVACAFTGMLINLRYGLNTEICELVLKNRAVFIFLLTILFYLLVLSKLESSKLKCMDSFLERIIQFNIVILLIEGVALNIFGMSDLLKQFFHEAGYRIGTYYGVFGIAPNGLVFGRQNASIISIIGILRWFPWNSDWLRISLRKSIWLIAAMFAWALTMTTTSIICFASVVAFVYFFGLARKFRWCIICLVILSPFIVLKYYDSYLINKVGHIRTKEAVRENTAKLLYTFTQPINVMINEPAELMIGSGNISKNNVSKYSPEYLAKIRSGDVASVFIIIKYGALLISIIFFSYLIYVIKVLWHLIKLPTTHIHNKNIVLNSLITTIVLVLSTIHYATLLQNGMMQLFASSIALSYVMIKKQETDKTLHHI